MSIKFIKPIRNSFLLAVLLLASCDGTVYYSEYADINEGGWKVSDSACFDVHVDDTTHFFDLLVEVRNNEEYPYSNLFLFVNTTFPDGSVSCDTMELPLADPSGVWLGKHSGRYVDSRYRLRGQPVRFPMMGSYHFAIAHGMRGESDGKDIGAEVVKDIAHVGFLVEYSKAE